MGTFSPRRRFCLVWGSDCNCNYRQGGQSSRMKREEEKICNFFQLVKLLYGFQLNETSAEMHGDLERFFVHRPVSHFHRLIDVFYRVSVTE